MLIKMLNIMLISIYVRHLLIKETGVSLPSSYSCSENLCWRHLFIEKMASKNPKIAIR